MDADDAWRSAEINKMDKQFERVKEILGKDCKRSSQNAIMYGPKLKKTNTNLQYQNAHYVFHA